jgi:hypothetical protein
MLSAGKSPTGTHKQGQTKLYTSNSNIAQVTKRVNKKLPKRGAIEILPGTRAKIQQNKREKSTKYDCTQFNTVRIIPTRPRASGP